MSAPEWEGSKLYIQCMDLIKRAARAYDYMMGTLSEADAQTVMWEVQNPAHNYILALLSSEDVLNEAVGEFGEYEDFDRAEELADMAAEAAADDCDYGELESYTREFAVEKFREYAQEAGIVLVPRNEEGV